jgi:alpha-glucosidase
MVGADLLAAPILHEGQNGRLVYLPAGTWIDYWTGKKFEGGGTFHVDAPLDTVPLFVRGGAMIPMGPEMNYVGEKTGPLTFSIYPDSQGHAETALYEDDGTSQAYLTGVERRTTISYQGSESGSEIDLGAAAGTYQPAARKVIFSVRGALTRQALVDGRALGQTSEFDGAAGWWRSGNWVSVQIADDGKAHKIELR